MKPAATSKEEILKTCRHMASTQGWNDLNIRNVSSACQVSVGCLYHYFPSKSDLVSATVISIWQEIFHLPEGFLEQNDLKALLKQWYAQMEDVFHTYPGFATMHARLIASNERQESSVFMRRTWKQIVRTIALTIKKDPSISANRFDPAFSSEQAAQILFSLLLASIVEENYDPSLILTAADRLLF